ncbi:MAG: carotenoid biosynthesis protein [Mycobacteriales bacterium]
MPTALAGLTVLLQIAYPLVGGHPRDLLTVATVAVLFAASVTHALRHRGGRWTAAFLAVTVGGGLLVEAVGVATGFPFGSYAYTGSLGPKLLAVPVVVPLAWAMFAYPALVAGARLGHRLVAGAFALASWDLFLDPQMVAAGHWHWHDSGPALNGVPLQNHLAWLAVALVMAALLPLAPADDDRVPLGLLVWTWASSVLANLVFFHRPAVALAGGLAMGVVAVPVLRRRSWT